MRISFVALFAVAAVASLSAHIMVSPPQSKAGASQRYELRVHNEAKVATAEVDLEIPEGLTVVSIAAAPAGTYTTAKTGDRITRLMWKVEVQPGKYLALPFTAKNPDGVSEVHWNVQEHLADGSVIDWSDKPGAREKAPATKIVAAN